MRRGSPSNTLLSCAWSQDSQHPTVLQQLALRELVSAMPVAEEQWDARSPGTWSLCTRNPHRKISNYISVLCSLVTYMLCLYVCHNHLLLDWIRSLYIRALFSIRIMKFSVLRLERKAGLASVMARHSQTFLVAKVDRYSYISWHIPACEREKNTQMRARNYVLVIPWPSVVLGIYTNPCGIYQSPWYKSLRQQLGHMVWVVYTICYYGFCCDLQDCITSQSPNMEMYTWHSAFIVGKIQSVLVQFYHYICDMEYITCQLP